ncbi:MAG: bifunctional indole-3-glycerol phosphate synthase/phosphoribosylanthranilate isomerase [Spirochaetia bacterium]|jgi:indole-3-glycerol phosphate synthase/phosphoribosylanthranilate isomerase|nr:bifunctional indole-3-glycerol phosphate synthase/phosphoribosylanthranilate isomerase [Spirochaetia bacterium]
MENKIFSTGDIRAEIAERRREDLLKFGSSQELTLPEDRMYPLVPFLKDSPVICEVKRQSPSVADIDRSLDPLKLVGNYAASGIKNVSVLTEQNYFGGALEDLMEIKAAYPGISLLRKDFLLNEEDIRVSYLAGADAFLLIASLLEKDQMEKMYQLGLLLGMEALVELHDSEYVDKARSFEPATVGINSRNLKTFGIHPVVPLKIRALIDWPCRIVYESGVKTDYDINFVWGTGFQAVLVGESAVRDSSFPEKLLKRFRAGPVADNRFTFWTKLYQKSIPGKALVKICGITRHEDLREIVRLGANAAGFILAASPRKVSTDFIRSCRDFDILKIGVVVLEKGMELPEEIAGLIKEGFLDAIQFHGDEEPSEYLRWPGYKAVRLRDMEDVKELKSVPGPTVLIDAFSIQSRGGSGKRIDPKLVLSVKNQQELWLAGGINPANIKEIIRTFSPDLIDVSSGVEESPGIKDHNKLQSLFKGLIEAQEHSSNG